jgi:hypothetical protein
VIIEEFRREKDKAGRKNMLNKIQGRRHIEKIVNTGSFYYSEF